MIRATGFVVFRRVQNDIQYLLLQTSYGTHHWTPPKGHVDQGENDRDTALRETKEESGLQPSDLNIYWDFETLLEYKVRGKNKKVVYFLAELLNPETPIKLSDEHEDFKWLPLIDACKIAEYPQMQYLFQEADKFINGSIRSG